VLNRFISNIESGNLFNQKDNLLLAFSGGVDSVALAILLLKAGYKFDLAHCNFNLRGKESDADEKFCNDFSKKLKLKIHIKEFDTKSYMKIKKLSVQMAARELRYKWFNDLVKKNKYNYILTAHHANDNIETLLINLVRGTGINGLLGIPAKQNNIVRPLLFASKEDVYNYCSENKLKFRHDSSNDEVKYARNYLRHEVIPGLKKLNPALESTFNNNIKLFKECALITNNYIKQAANVTLIKSEDSLKISIVELMKQSAPGLLLHEWLSPYGFNSTQTTQLLKSLKTTEPGKIFQSDTHKLLIDRAFIITDKINPIETENSFTIKSVAGFKKLPVKIKAEVINDTTIIPDNKTVKLNFKALVFPLVLRRWENGDKFMPLGMHGFKKVSDFLTGIKMPLFEKDKVWLLVNGNGEIIWVTGFRIDERYKITPKTKSVLKLVIS